jgi:hypothetical protein
MGMKMLNPMAAATQEFLVVDDEDDDDSDDNRDGSASSVLAAPADATDAPRVSVSSALVTAVSSYAQSV